MGLKHYNGYYKALRQVRQEEYKREDTQKEYLRRQEEAFKRINDSYKFRDKDKDN